MLINHTETKKYFKTNPINIIDAGARSGLIAPWNEFSTDVLNVFGFEPEHDGFNHLNSSSNSNNVYFPYALWNKVEKIKLYIAKDESTSSVFPPNKNLLEYFLPAESSSRLTKKIIEVDAISIDQLAHEKQIDIDFIKIDTHGAEYEILKGAQNSLQNTLGAHVEVWAKEIHKGQKLMGEIIGYMESNNFRVFEINDFGKWYRKSQAQIEKYSKRELVILDILFLKDIDLNEVTYTFPKVIKLACIAEAYGFPQYALFLLNQLTNLNHNNDPLINSLKAAITSDWRQSKENKFTLIKRSIKRKIENAFNIEIRKKIIK